MITVRLPETSLRYAIAVGVDRMLAGMTKPGRYGAKQADGWRLNILGACGEAAVAQQLNVWWDGALGNFGAKDVGRMQCRATGLETGALIVHQADRDEDVFVLVVGARLPEMQLMGWVWGHEAKQERYWREAYPGHGRPAYFVPPGDLHDMATLPGRDEPRRGG